MRRLVLTAIAVLSGAACGDPTHPPLPDPGPTPAADISIEASVTVLRGSTARTGLAATDSSGAPIPNPDFRVASSDSAVVLPSLDGNTLVIEGRAAGTATVTVSATGAKDTSRVTVVIPASQLQPTTMSVSFPAGYNARAYRGQRFVAVTELRSNGTRVWPTSPVTWEVSDPSIVRLVHSAGDSAVFEGTATGYVTVVAKYGALASWPVGKTVYELPPLPAPQKVVGTQQWRDVAAHAYSTCATTTVGAVFCWGQLPADGTAASAWEPKVQAVATPASALSVARDHVCAIAQAGGIYCWGGSGFQNLIRSGMPLIDSPLTGTATGVAAGRDHSCLIAPDGAAWCWGYSEHGQTGVLTPEAEWCSPIPYYCRRAPQAVAGDLRFIRLVAGDRYTCGLRSTGDAWCWGADALGGPPPATCARAPRLGPAPHSVPCAPSPRLISGTTDAPGTAPVFTSISGSRAQVCGVTTGGRAYCWDARNIAPEPAAGTLTFTSVAAGDAHACGVTSTGAVACWGRGVEGQLGRAIESSATPLEVALPHAAVAVAAGMSHSCALLTTRELWCWGAGDLGQLGVGPGSATPSANRVGVE